MPGVDVAKKLDHSRISGHSDRISRIVLSKPSERRGPAYAWVPRW